MTTHEVRTKKIVISQPMFFPWLGFLELIKCADVYVNYDDVDFSKGSFSNRVQLHGSAKTNWMTVPLRVKASPSKQIDTVLIDNEQNWKLKHLNKLNELYKACDYYDEVMRFVETIYLDHFRTLSEVAWRSTFELIRYFKLSEDLEVVNICDLEIDGSSHQRVLSVVKHLQGTHYISAFGGRRYLNHQSFENEGVELQYIQYSLTEYSQQSEDFNPYVSALDAIANLGPYATQLLSPSTKHWSEI